MGLLVLGTGLWLAPLLEVTGPSIEALVERVHPEARPAFAARPGPRAL